MLKDKIKNSTLLIIVYGIMGIAANLAHPVTPQLLKSLNLSSSVFGHAYAAMVLGSFLFSPFWGNLCNYVQPKKILLISCWGYGLAQAVFGISTSLNMIMTARLFSGFFVSASGIAVIFLLTRLKGENNKSLIPVLITTFTVLGTFGQFLGGFIGEYNIKYPFVLQVILLFICGLMFYFLMEKLELDTNLKIKEVVKQSNPLKSFFEVKKYLNPLFITQFITVFLLSFGAVAFSQSFGYYVADILNMGSSINGNVRGLAGILAIALNFYITPKIIKSKHVEKSGSLVTLVIVAAISLMLYFNYMNFVFISLAVLMISFDSIMVSLVQERTNAYSNKENQGVILGGHNSIRGLGGIFGSLISGYVYQFSPLNPFILTFILYLASFFSLLILSRIKDRYTNI